MNITNRLFSKLALVDKFHDFCADVLQNFESICIHLVEKFCSKDTKKHEFSDQMEFRKKSNKLLKVLLSTLLVISPYLQADVTVHLNRYDIHQNESFQLMFTSDQGINQEIDFSPLEKDFKIISYQQGTNVRLINGTLKQEISWILTLSSRKTGDIEIPSIQFGPFQTKSITIHVADALAPSKDDPIYIEAKLSPSDEVFQNSQVILTIKLVRKVNLMNGAVSALQLSDPDATVQQIGTDQEYEIFENGRQSLVLEKSFAIQPAKVGKLVISPVEFTGQMMVGRSMFDLNTRHIQISTQELRLKVLPIPEGFTKQNWLAADDVQIYDEWSAKTDQLPLGEPITRTVTIRASGALASQIPALEINISKDFKQYEDKPSIRDTKSADGNIGIKQLTTTLIPTKAGSYTFPKIEVKWWNLKTKSASLAVIPEVTVVVTNAAEKVAEAESSAALNEKVAEDNVDTKSTQLHVARLPAFVLILIGAGSACLAIAFSFLIYRAASKAKKPMDQVEKTKGQCKQNLKAACRGNAPKEAEKMLLLWAESIFPLDPPRTLAGLQSKVASHPHLKEAINALEKILYSPLDQSKASWSGDELFSQVKQFKRPKDNAKKGKQPVLHNLYN